MADKTLEEIKSEILHRAGRINPFERVRKADVEQVVENLVSLDSDLWGREWGKYGAKHEAMLGGHPIVTQIVPLTTFYPAEQYHQDYYANNAAQPYCQIVIAPKVAKFRKKYLDRLARR